MSYSCGLGTTSDSSVISRIGWSAGLIFRYLGSDGRFDGQKSRRGVDGRLHFARRRIDVAAQIELQRDLRGSDRAAGRHFRDARDARELLLERSGDRSRHHLGTCARQAGADVDGREIDLRQRRDRQQRIGDPAGQRQRDQQQRGGDRPLNEWSGNAHMLQPYVSVGTGRSCSSSSEPRDRPTQAAIRPKNK